MDKNVINEFNVLVDRAGGQNTSRMNEIHGEVVTELDRIGRADLVKKVQTAEAYNQVVGDTLDQLQQWGDKNLKEGPIAPPVEPPVEPPYTPPAGGTSPVAVLPNDSVTLHFGPIFQNTVYRTLAGGPGKFSFSTGSGNAYHKVWVNGTIVVDGGMTEQPVAKGDIIQFMITTQTQNNCTYSINQR